MWEIEKCKVGGWYIELIVYVCWGVGFCERLEFFDEEVDVVVDDVFLFEKGFLVEGVGESVVLVGVVVVVSYG